MTYGLLVLGVALSLSASEAFANRINRREGAQRGRIHEGVKSGELTRGEAARARGEQRRIGRMEDKAEADGTVTGQERAKINHEQNRASRQIRRLKHNDKRREP